jgi:rhodanese-related sulfurtransferase
MPEPLSEQRSAFPALSGGWPGRADPILTGGIMDHSERFLKIVDDTKSRIQEISVAGTRKKLDAGNPVFFIDVREDHEWAKGHAKGALHLGKGIIERDIEKTVPDQNAEIILYCGGGYRSALAADALQKMGYRRVFSMAGGYKDWVESGQPVVQE